MAHLLQKLVTTKIKASQSSKIKPTEATISQLQAGPTNFRILFNTWNVLTHQPKKMHFVSKLIMPTWVRNTKT